MNITIISILSGIGGMFGWGVYDFLGGVFAKQIGSHRSLFWSQLSGFLSIFLLAFLVQIDTHLSARMLLLGMIAAILYAGGYLFFFKGFELGNVSIIAATMNLWAVFTMLIAFLFMGQRLSTLQTFGVVLILCGATLTSLNWNALRNQKFTVSGGVKETVFGAFLFGVYWNVSEIISEEAGWLWTTLIIKLGIIFFLFLFSWISRRTIGLGEVSVKTKSVLLLMGIAEVGAVASVNYGLTIGEAILITPIASALSVVTISLAMVFLREKIATVQGMGMLLAVAGIVITAF